MVIALRPHHHVHDGRAADDLLAFGLRDAAGHRNVHLAAIARGFVLDEAQPPQFRIDFLGSLFADVTGVEDHQIRIVHACGLDKAFPCQRVHHALRIVDIHLTTIGLDMQLARRLHGTWMLCVKRRHQRHPAHL